MVYAFRVFWGMGGTVVKCLSYLGDCKNNSQNLAVNIILHSHINSVAFTYLI